MNEEVRNNLIEYLLLKTYKDRSFFIYMTNEELEEQLWSLGIDGLFKHRNFYTL